MDTGPSDEPSAERPVPDEREGPLAVAREGIGEAGDVLPLAERADAEERRSLRLPAELGAGGLAVARREPVEIDAAVDHGRLARRAGRCSLETQPQPVRDSDDRRRTPHGEPSRAAHHARALGVRNVLAVGGQDGGCPSCDRAEQPRRNEEVRVDDVRPEASSGPHHVAGEDQVPPVAAPAVDDRPREVVPALLEPRLEVGHECPQRRRGRPRVHLGDEQDAHACAVSRG